MRTIQVLSICNVLLAALVISATATASQADCWFENRIKPNNSWGEIVELSADTKVGVLKTPIGDAIINGDLKNPKGPILITLNIGPNSRVSAKSKVLIDAGSDQYF